MGFLLFLMHNMEPTSFLVYLSIVVIAILGVQLFFVLLRVINILRSVQRITDAIDNVSDAVSILQKAPLKNIRKALDIFRGKKKDS